MAHGSDSAPGSRHYRLDHDNIHFHPGFDPTLDISYEGRQLPKEYWSPGGIVRGGIHGGEAGPQGVAMVTCVGNTKQPLPDSAADAVIKKEWLADGFGFGANSQNFFAERQKRGTSAAAVGFEHYTMGGGNTPYVQRRSDARAERGSICIQCVRMNAVMSTVSSRHNLCGLT